MGLFNRKKGKNENETKQSRTSGIFPYSLSLSNGNKIMILSVQDNNDVKHRDGRISKIKVALLSNEYTDNGQAMSFEPGKYIVFDVDENQKIDESFLYNLMVQYYVQGKNENICQYMGEYNKDSKIFEQKSSAVKNYVDTVLANNIQEQIEQKRGDLDRKIEEIYDAENWKDQYDAKEYINGNKADCANRIANPYIYGTENFEIDNKKYYNYNGVNINTGKILKIRKLDEVDTDGEGTYLYAGYIQSTQNESDAEILNKNQEPLGKYICFETKKRVEDIVNDQNTPEISSLLELLSFGTETDYVNNGKLNYIGSIDEYGNIERAGMPKSENIRKTVKDMQDAYALKDGTYERYN